MGCHVVVAASAGMVVSEEMGTGLPSLQSSTVHGAPASTLHDLRQVTYPLVPPFPHLQHEEILTISLSPF